MHEYMVYISIALREYMVARVQGCMRTGSHEYRVTRGPEVT